MRKLRLSREVLGELGPDQLRSVAGASHLCATDRCATDQCTHVSCDAACNSVDPAQCLGLTTPAACPTNACFESLTGVCCM